SDRGSIGPTRPPPVTTRAGRTTGRRPGLPPRRIEDGPQLRDSAGFSPASRLRSLGTVRGQRAARNLPMGTFEGRCSLLHRLTFLRIVAEGPTHDHVRTRVPALRRTRPRVAHAMGSPAGGLHPAA